MRETIKLRNPIMIDGKSVEEITYDTNEITAALYAEAAAKCKIAAGMKNVAITPAVEFDFGLHLYMGLAAAIAINPGYAFEDLERVKGADTVAFSSVGRSFLLKSEESQPETSEEQSETIPEPTTQAPSSSNENE